MGQGTAAALPACTLYYMTLHSSIPVSISVFQLYEPESDSRKIINNISDNYYLVSIRVTLGLVGLVG